MEEENQNRMNLEDMINLRHWALKRKRRSFGEILKKKPLFKSASFRVIEENREEIKLLKTFRTNLKNERRAKRKDDVKDLDKIIEENKKTQLTERSNFNETLKLYIVIIK